MQILQSAFLSTPSARRATILWDNFKYFMGISIHALREEGDTPINDSSFTKSFISIHALREEGDPVRAADKASSWYFYPRPPRGGRHEIYHALHDDVNISIHALREEGDPCKPF